VRALLFVNGFGLSNRRRSEADPEAIPEAITEAIISRLYDVCLCLRLLPSFASAVAILCLSLQQFALHGISKLRHGWHGFVDIMFR
jgi:hypothetical protein